MLFTELRFLPFFALVFAIHWLLPRNRQRKLWLLACSYLFYAAWDWRFLGLIVASTLVDYSAGLAMGRSSDRRHRRPWLIASLVVNLGILGLFKYYGFFLESAMELLAFLGLPISAHSLQIILPVGISFYTFQTLSYTIDVYRGRLEPIRRPFDFALFVAFFPQLVAGPIVRASDLLPQLAVRRRFREVEGRACLTLFLSGYIKKACIADNIALVVDPAFADPAATGSATLWLAMLLYGVQIYCDFSGYSDMAIATAGLLGYRLPDNFRSPYLAGNIRDFWRRWHISLSSWFRDYLYLPLGGSRRSSARTYINLCVVFVLCGLWHGANWTFIAWGLIHGAFLVLERLLGWKADDARKFPRLVATQLVVMLAWVPFRSPSLEQALLYYRGLLPFASTETRSAPLGWGWWLLLAALWLLHFALARRAPQDRQRALPDLAFAAAVGVAVALVLPWVVADYQPFIYFQF